MTAATILTTLHNQGITVRVLPQGKLAVGPKTLLTAELRGLVRQHKEALVTALQKPAEQRPLWDQPRRLPPPLPVSEDATHRTVAFNILMEEWRQHRNYLPPERPWTFFPSLPESEEED
jgi:hypothetical protein